MRKQGWVLLALAGLLASGALARAADKADAVKEELKKLQGTWQTVSVKGEKASKDGGRLEVEIKGNKMIAQDRETEFRIDPTKKPKTLDMIDEVTIASRDKNTGEIKTVKGKDTTRAIYTLDGDTLTLCVCAKLRGERPSKIEATGDNVVVVLKRQKP